ncbi:hypothetical protein LOC68_14365 [Blastopirellula sp. JC732]|uniref:2TM domain-containing protein n=1 Tax=Blastopirellula sediminis TaxID=2894196 RepID=A0A9X1MMW7_9BACT|nr:hypothetical protein [Blastopirellula sediminis]MCC9607133.1 hypothetical protein [Blastopirellula sediminis]MCC9629574.1 hypothetical protein [Blastopirellula sediminis]
MNQPPEEEFDSASSPSDVTPSRYQFTLRHLMLLMMLVSVIAAFFRLLPYSEEFFWFYAIYFGGVALYAVAHIPLINSELMRMRRAAARQREEAIAYAEEARRRKRAGEGK